MRTRPVFRLLVSMSVPMMLSMLIQSLYNIVDSIYVSWLGTDALTAVSLAYPLQNAIVSAGVGIGVGISSAGFLISSIGVIYSGTFEALGDGRRSLVISLLRQFVITIPVSFILSRFMGPAGIWIAFPAGENCAAVVAFFLLRFYQNGAFSPL